MCQTVGLTVDAGDARSLLRLISKVRDHPPDPIARKKHALHELCRLTHAKVGCSIIADMGANRDRPVIMTAVQVGWQERSVPLGVAHFLRTGEPTYPGTELFCRKLADSPQQCVTCRRQDLVDDKAWYTSVHAAEVHRPAGIDNCLHSALPLAGSNLVAVISLSRAWGAPSFSERDRQLLHLFHCEGAWLYQSDMLFANPESSLLSVRQRQTLQYLLAGNSEKQIAVAIGLSPNTVHHYVKLLYRHFSVSSRSELLARWVLK